MPHICLLSEWHTQPTWPGWLSFIWNKVFIPSSSSAYKSQSELKCLTRRLSRWVLSRFFTENLQHSWAKPGLLQIKEINLFRLEVLLTRLVGPRQTHWNCWLGLWLDLSPPYFKLPWSKVTLLYSCELVIGVYMTDFLKRNSMHSVWGSELCRAALHCSLWYLVSGIVQHTIKIFW